MTRKTKTTTPRSAASAPFISPPKALTRLQQLVDEIDSLRADLNESVKFGTWHRNVLIVLSQFYGEHSLQFEQFQRIHFSPIVLFSGMPDSVFHRDKLDGLAAAEGFLVSRIKEIAEDMHDTAAQPLGAATGLPEDVHKVFVVHGHDHGIKETVARYISKLGLTPVILHERPDEGRTIIEKFEHHADVSCAVVILTPDDVAYAKADSARQEERARQNVIFELGFFVGKIGRKRTFALVGKGVARPSDIDGVLYIPMDDDSTWRLQLLRELKASGMEVDANRAFD